MAFCANCGRELPAGATFCPNCGTAVAPQQRQETELDRLTKDSGTQEYWLRRVFAFVIDVLVVSVVEFFIAGAASCLLNQYAVLAIARDVRIDDLTITARGHFDRVLGGSFKEMIYDLRISSEASKETILNLSREAEKMCYAHNTLRKAGVRMVTNLFLNEKEIS